jgi:DeoR/GlpR family transcriptional regulator of sugar metabolism
MTCCGADPSVGVTAYDLMDAAAKSAMQASASRTILIAEGAKFSRAAMAIVCPLESVDLIVTDDSAPADLVAQLRDSGVHVEVA